MFLLVPAHPGFPGQIPQSHKTVVCCVFYHCISLSQVAAARDKIPGKRIPLLVKLAPDLSMLQKEDIASVVSKRRASKLLCLHESLITIVKNVLVKHGFVKLLILISNVLMPFIILLFL